jgi:signal transduction histidine kinase/ActR/RegA family two-component response regulator
MTNRGIRFSRPLPLRWHLVLLVIGALLPLVVFAVGVVLRLAAQERTAFERRLSHSTRLMAASVERETSGSLRILEALAESDPLDRGDLQGFYAEAQRVARSQPSWLTFLLLTPDGRHLIDTRRPWGSPLGRASDPESLAEVVRTRRPGVGNLAFRPEGKWGFPVRFPIVRDGEVRYVLTAIIEPASLTEVVIRQLPPNEEWTRTVVDRNGRVVARTRDPERFVGQMGTPQYLSQVRADSEGIFQTVSLEGVSVQVVFQRVQSSGWTVSTTTPIETVKGEVRRSLLAVAGLGLALLALSGAGAFFLARRVSRGIEAAAAAAVALAEGGRPRSEPSGIREVVHLREALERSGELLSRRERERDENLARVEAARTEAEEANRAKDEFLAMLGHELRNPLSPIVTALELLRLRGTLATHPRELGILERQVKHLTRLVDDLLDVSRITRGKVDLKVEPVELAVVVAKAVEMASPLLDRRQHRLAVEVPADGLRVQGDPVRLAQVVANLLTNAARYTPPGGHVQVRARRVHGEDEGAGEVELAVADDGQGLSADLLPRVFDLFVQGPRAIDRQEGGLGIGLTLVRSLVSLHGGSVEARSDGPGQGSTFVVRLPLLAAPGLALPEAGPAIAKGGSPLRILVVDDNQDAADLLGTLLAVDGHEVLTAHDGLGALALVEDAAPDVAVLDLGLPVMDGFELAALMRGRLGDAAPVFIAVTGYGQPADRDRSRDAGFQAHLVKPVDAGVLLATIRDLAPVARPVRSPVS